MIKAVIFDIDNTLYSYDENHIYGMEALAVYCRDSFGITTDEMQACYRKAGRIMTDRIGTDTAAIHSRMLRMQCMLELLEQPLFPHARNMYHAYWDTFIQTYTVKSGNPGIYERAEKKKNSYRNRDRHDCIRSVQKTGSNWCDIIIDFICYQRRSGGRETTLSFF